MAMDLHGKKYIGLLRCSSPGQKDTSIGEQRRLLESFATEHGLVCTDFVALEGASGSQPGNRSDIHQLIARKHERNDFDILLIQDTSRFTRGGVQHFHEIESRLNTAGIEVIFTTGSIPDGHIGELVKGVYAFADQHHAESISLAATRGGMSSILDGRSAYCRRPPYGIDRLYLSPAGEQLHIIRNLPNGTQHMLDPNSGEVRTTFGVNEKTGVPNHYIKQKQETVALIHGDTAAVEIVQRIYRRHFIDGWGTYRIAHELNLEAIPSPTGKKWNTQTINSILKNPIYLGRGIANRYSSAIYHRRAPDRPIPVSLSKSELNNQKRPLKCTRPQSDWCIQEYPQLAEFLDPQLRELAAAKQQAYLDRQAAGHKPKPNRRRSRFNPLRGRHLESPFFLKGILRSRQGDLPMTGVTTGKKGSKKRYYRISKAFNVPDGDRVLRKMVPAEPLETAVIETVKTVLLAKSDLRERIEQHVRHSLRQTIRDHDQLAALLKERDAIRRKLELIIDQFDAEMAELVEGKIAELKTHLQSIDDRLSRCETVAPADENTIKKRVEETIASITELGKTLANAPPAALRLYLQSLIAQLVVNLETREVRLGIALPASQKGEDIKVCLVEAFACKTFNQTHPGTTISLAFHRLVWDRRARKYLPSRNALPEVDGSAA